MKRKAPFKGLGYQGRYQDDDEPLPPRNISWFPLFEIVVIVAVVSFFGLVFNR